MSESEEEEELLFEGEGELELREESDELEEERRREKAALKERLRRVREPHLRRKMVLAEPIIPWEYGSNQHASQKGSGGFGVIRNATLKVQSSTELPMDANAVPRFALGKGSSQAGQTPFGAHREQVTRMVEHEGEGKKRCQELLPDPKQTERILTLWTRPNPEAKNHKLFGWKRPVKVNAVGGRPWTREELQRQRAALPRLACVNDTSAARDGREAIRGTVAGYAPSRQATMQIAGLDRTERDQLESNKCLGWLGGQLLLQTQSRTGGFQAPRDVVNTSYYARLMQDCTEWKRGDRAHLEEKKRKMREERRKRLAEEEEEKGQEGKLEEGMRRVSVEECGKENSEQELDESENA